MYQTSHFSLEEPGANERILRGSLLQIDIPLHHYHHHQPLFIHSGGKKDQTLILSGALTIDTIKTLIYTYRT